MRKNIEIVIAFIGTIIEIGIVAFIVVNKFAFNNVVQLDGNVAVIILFVMAIFAVYVFRVVDKYSDRIN